MVVDTLIKIATNADAIARPDNVFGIISRNIMISATVQGMLPEAGKRLAVIKFYEAIKGLQSAKSNPFFWLQYAIARLVFSDFEKAGVYFENAYSFAQKRPRFNTCQIDNHFVRYLLTREIEQGKLETCMNSFRRAHEILMAQMRVEYRHYPYRHAINYFPFYEKFYKGLAQNDKAFFVGACESVLGKIANLPPERRLHHYVVECKEKLSLIVKTEEGQ
jgi:hypothetical protein